MIKVNDRFEFERGQYDWQLHESTPSKDKDGNPSVKRKTTYHPNMKQICGVIIDRSCGDCGSLQQIFSLLTDNEFFFACKIENAVKEENAIKKETTQRRINQQNAMEGLS